MSHPSFKRLDYHQAPKGNFLRHCSNRGFLTANARIENAVAKHVVRATPVIRHPVFCAAAHTFTRPESTKGRMPVPVAAGRQSLLVGIDFDRNRAVLTRKAPLDQLEDDKTPLVGVHPAGARRRGTYRQCLPFHPTPDLPAC
jgi:hypothetical protein